MSMLITKVLTDEGNEHGYINVLLRPTNVSEVFSELSSKYESWMSASGISFSSHIEDALYAMADPVQLEQAVHNFMMNAFRHTRPGKQVKLSCLREKHYLRISVYNDGNGIPREQMKSIWENAWQGDANRSRQEIGLGLYITKDIVTQHHGTCGVVNRTQGVEFWVIIPLLEDD